MWMDQLYFIIRAAPQGVSLSANSVWSGQLGPEGRTPQTLSLITTAGFLSVVRTQ